MVTHADYAVVQDYCITFNTGTSILHCCLAMTCCIAMNAVASSASSTATAIVRMVAASPCFLAMMERPAILPMMIEFVF